MDKLMQKREFWAALEAARQPKPQRAAPVQRRVGGGRIDPGTAR